MNVSPFINPSGQSDIKLAKVAAGYVGGRPSVIYDSDILTGELSKPMPYLASYTPHPNDRVMIIKGVIVGKIV
jgi:hypothetical protein